MPLIDHSVLMIIFGSVIFSLPGLKIESGYLEELSLEMERGMVALQPVPTIKPMEAFW